MNHSIFKEQDLLLSRITNKKTEEQFIIIQDCENNITIENVSNGNKTILDKNELLDSFEITEW